MARRMNSPRGDGASLYRFSDHALRSVDIAVQLGHGALGAGYVQASAILVGLIGGIASRQWPKGGNDRNRFVELLATCTPPDLHATHTSVPLLMQDLKKRGDRGAAERLARAFPSAFGPGQDCRVLTAEDVDRPEEEIAALTGLELKELRAFSYANLLYRQVRNAIVHEFRLGTEATAVAMTTRSAAVSYSNSLEGSTGRGGTTRRRIFFSLEWFAALTASAALVLDQDPPPGQGPSTWWIAPR